MNVPGCFYKFDCWIGLKGRGRGVGAAVFGQASLTISAKGEPKVSGGCAPAPLRRQGGAFGAEGNDWCI